MEASREPPPDYVSHAPSSVQLPAVPQHDFVPAPIETDLRLPDLRTVLSAEGYAASPSSHAHRLSRSSPGAAHTTGLPPIDVGNAQYSGGRRSMESAIISTSETGSSTIGEELSFRSSGRVSMDDPDVRIAAEALSGLGNPDFTRSPRHMIPQRDHSHYHHHTHDMMADEPEPILELLTQAHPWVGGTINGSLNAYETTKHYSPRFVRAGVNLVERNIGMPMVSTVGSVGRMTGVESVARWYLNTRRPGDLERMDEDGSGGSKRRRLDADEMDMENGVASPRNSFNTRRDSQDSRADSLPAYRASKPPSYREEVSPSSTERQGQSRPPHNRSWSSQVIVATSGLGVALSDTSRNSLVYCLSLLGRSAEHIATVTDALKIVLEQYDQARDHWHKSREAAIEQGGRPQTPDHDESARRLAAVIKKHSDDIWDTLKRVVNSVSNTTGGALPTNARNFVRDQLMSLPQRWQVVSAHQRGDSETSRNAHRMVDFAMQGLEMMTEVSKVCQATLESAERWLDMVGRRRRMGPPPAEKSGGGGGGDTDMAMDVDQRPAGGLQYQYAGETH